MSTTILNSNYQMVQQVVNVDIALNTLVERLGGMDVSLTNINKNGLKEYAASADKASKSTLNFSSIFKGLEKAFTTIVDGIKKVWGSIEDTTDYTEAFNYYNTTVGKIASEWSGDWEKYGFQNAKSYADSFSERMNELFGKMSGMQMNAETGVWEESGNKSLGLDIKEVTQFAATLTDITNITGQTGEVSLATSKALTMLAGDLSAVFSADYSTMAERLKNALIGQSEELENYGIKLADTTLQTYAYELGLEKTVAEMNQTELMQLRLLAVLEQSKSSWGALANSINSPSVMINQFKNHINDLSVMLGQLFVPLLQKIMPIVNGVAISIKRLLENVAGFFGMQINIEDFGQSYTELAGKLNNVSGAYGEATTASKELKTATLGIDELNINAPKEDASGKVTTPGTYSTNLVGEILNLTGRYENVYDEAYEQMESRAQEFANKIGESFESVKNVFSDIVNVFIPNDQSINDFFLAINTIAEGLQNVLEFLCARVLPDLEKGWSELLEILTPFIEFLEEVYNDIWQEMINPALTYIGEIALPKITEVLKNLWDNVLVPFGELLAEVLKPILIIITEVLTYIWQDVIIPLADAVGGILVASFEGICDIFNGTVIPVVNIIIALFQFLWDNVFSPLINNLWEKFKPAFDNVFGAINGLIDGLSTALEGLIVFLTGTFSGNWLRAWEGIKEIFRGIFNSLIGIAEGAINMLIDGINYFTSGFDGIVESFGELIGIELTIPDIPKVSLPKLKKEDFANGENLLIASTYEMMGNIEAVGNKTAVANGIEVADIINAVHSAGQTEESLLKTTVNLLQEIANKDMSVNIGDREIARANYRGQKSIGRRMIADV